VIAKDIKLVLVISPSYHVEVKDFQLRALLHVADAGSIRAAARALGLSQPAVTKALRDLEASVDAPLVHRNSRGVELTECGRQLAKRARLAQAQLTMARQDIAQLQGGKQALVSVAITPAVFMGALPDVLREFKREMPLAQVKLYEGLMPQALPLLREGRVEFAVAAPIETAVDPDLEFEPICSLEMMFVCRAGHALANATRWDEVVDADWLVQQASGSHHTVFLDRLKSQGLSLPRSIVEVSTFGVSWGLLTRSDMLTILPTRFLEILPYGQQIARVPLQMPLLPLTLGILKLRSAPLSLAATQLATLFTRYCR